MIKVLFPPGCYGNYFTKCIYSYSNLRTEEFEDFFFDTTGSSHNRREHTQSNKFINCGHLGQLDIEHNDLAISLIAEHNHYLDYYNNQFFKQQHGQLIEYIKVSLPEHEIQQKLKEHWGYESGLTEKTPHWILREWCSFWITDSWDHAYNDVRYQSISENIINVNDIINNLEQTLSKLFDTIDLTLTVDSATINKNHKKFLSLQQFHNSQIRCMEWVDCVINSNLNVDLNIQTIFDEAYIQYLLRTKGYEIYCDGVNELPTSSISMKKLIYND